MPPSIHPVRLNHMNAVLESVDDSVAHFRELYGADLLADMPQAEVHAYLVDVGRTIIEGFVPLQFLFTARYGPHYVGVEYQADMDEVRQAVAERGIRIVRDIGIALHTHPADCFGVAFEFYNGYFHDRTWDMLDGRKMRPASYWCDEHELGITGLHGYTLAVNDLSAAAEFLEDFLCAEECYETDYSDIAARGMQVADAVVEVVTPLASGSLEDHLRRYGDGIHATIFNVRDIDAARRYFQARDVLVADGLAPDAISISAEHNSGIAFEFRA